MPIVKKVAFLTSMNYMKWNQSIDLKLFLPFDVQPLFHLFSKKTLRGAPRELNYGAMIQVLVWNKD
ncbi:hypothetical protein JFL43_22120 [Viridibacillus sp. YIM B01967]|uniref:Transposase n=1 Tax=Viridibacillus soli TaxID=2798301 RepID=A0ABS1HDC3_9BACL|nr:hypothetical protein [Viridibacillus soli]